MLALNAISLSFGARPLFKELDWVLGDGERVALVGPNGVGKTTLFRIALGEIEPDAGTVTRSRHVRTGYLPQEEIPLPGETALASALGAFEAAVDAERELAELHETLAVLPPDDPELEALLKRLGDLQHLFEEADGYRMQAEAERVLGGLGLSAVQIHGPLNALSGGWRMRVALARLLLARPTHLFLDEPTNHLDLPSLAWLEEYLDEFSGTLVVISHDRAFLDRTVRMIYEVDGLALASYAGNYTFYDAERERRRAALIAAQANQARRIAEVERFIERFRAKNTKARQVKSREKLLERTERIEIKGHARTIHFTFAPAPRSGRVVVELEGVSKSYAAIDGGRRPAEATAGRARATEVFCDLDFRVERGEKLVLVGPNGAGKSTLLRILAGTEEVDRGERRLDEKARVAVFSQHTSDGLALDNTVLEEIQVAAPGEGEPRLRTLLGAFLFRADDVFKLVQVLSGGEKARLAIAKTLVQPVNFLLFDEPTNHLDMAGKDVLLDALRQYDGTLVLVTHDRHFIDGLATRVVEVRPGSRVRSFPGNFTDYAERLAAEGTPLPGYRPDPARALAMPQSMGDSTGNVGAGSPKKRESRVKRKPRDGRPAKPSAPQGSAPRNERARQAEERRLIQRMNELEAEQGRIEGQLAVPQAYTDGERARELLKEYERIRAEIAALWDLLEQQEKSSSRGDDSRSN